MTIVVTGSARADRLRLEHRLSQPLAPYLGMGVTWYCGNGRADEAAWEYLLTHDERVVVIAYHRLDYSERVWLAVEAKQALFVDTDVEPLPRGLTGPSARDILFCAKAA
jgi:hypothetical protein